MNRAFEAGYSPNFPVPGSLADNWAFGVTLVLLEGKMRALFSIRFGASLLLFVERQDNKGRNGAELQIRRLLWLALLEWLWRSLTEWKVLPVRR